MVTDGNGWQRMATDKIMTNEEAIRAIQSVIDNIDDVERPPKKQELLHFAKWVMNEIFETSHNWNIVLFKDEACKKLNMMGLLDVEPNKSEVI